MPDHMIAMPGYEIDYTAYPGCYDPYPTPTLADSIKQTTKKLIPLIKIIKSKKSIALYTGYQSMPTENQRQAARNMMEEQLEGHAFDLLGAWHSQKIILPQFDWKTSLSSIAEMAEYKIMEEVALGLKVVYRQPYITPNNAKYVLERHPHMEPLIYAVGQWHETLSLIVRKEALLEAKVMNPVERHTCADILAIAQANWLTASRTLPPSQSNLRAMDFVKMAIWVLKAHIQLLDTEILYQGVKKKTSGASEGDFGDASEGDFSDDDDDTGDGRAITNEMPPQYSNEPYNSGCAEGKTMEESTTEPKKKKNNKKKNKKKANEANVGDFGDVGDDDKYGPIVDVD